jgi:hypothetical protein
MRSPQQGGGTKIPLAAGWVRMDETILFYRHFNPA